MIMKRLYISCHFLFQLLTATGGMVGALTALSADTAQSAGKCSSNTEQQHEISNNVVCATSKASDAQSDQSLC